MPAAAAHAVPARTPLADTPRTRATVRSDRYGRLRDRSRLAEGAAGAARLPEGLHPPQVRCERRRLLFPPAFRKRLLEPAPGTGAAAGASRGHPFLGRPLIAATEASCAGAVPVSPCAAPPARCRGFTWCFPWCWGGNQPCSVPPVAPGLVGVPGLLPPRGRGCFGSFPRRELRSARTPRPCPAGTGAARGSPPRRAERPAGRLRAAGERGVVLVVMGNNSLWKCGM